MMGGVTSKHIASGIVTPEEALYMLKQKQSRDRRSLREQGLEGMTGSISLATPLKLTSPCTLTWYEDGACGPPVECRLALVGNVVSVSELLPTRKGLSVIDDVGHKGGKGNQLFAEHLKGKMDVHRLVVAEWKRFGKGGEAGSPMANPNNASSPLRTSNSHNNMTSSINVSTSNAANANLPGVGSAKSPTPIAPVFHGRVLYVGTSDGRPLFAKGVDAMENSFLSEPSADLGPETSASSWAMNNASATNNNNSSNNNNNNARANMATWTGMIVKFSNVRDQERWLTLLRCIEEADAWREFAKNVPNPDTFNLFASRFLFQNFSGNGFVDLLIGAIRKKLKKVSLTKFPRDLEGDILLDDFVLGNALPWISEVSDPTISTNGEFGFDFNIQYKGGEEAFTLYFRLALAYRGIRIPHVVFSVKLLELEGTAHISIGPPPTPKFWIGGHKPPVVRLEVRQGGACGKGLLHRILTSLPDLSGIMTNLIKLYLFSDMILPFMDDFPLPSVESAPKVRVEKKRRTFDRRRAAELSGAPPPSKEVPKAEGSGDRSPPPPTNLSVSADHYTESDSLSTSTRSLRKRPNVSPSNASVSTSKRRNVSRNLKVELKMKGKDMDAQAAGRSKTS
ncbi:hypothetical protein AGDE_16089 [Angomonas deanei]|nr:hypothetical protein AGDE_16089 [Angomonas deanei]|eukprot:EPY17726.1 hypothetical protein AGDE_16089 [Angomonas deanei]